MKKIMLNKPSTSKAHKKAWHHHHHFVLQSQFLSVPWRIKVFFFSAGGWYIFTDCIQTRPSPPSSFSSSLSFLTKFASLFPLVFLVCPFKKQCTVKQKRENGEYINKYFLFDVYSSYSLFLPSSYQPTHHRHHFFSKEKRKTGSNINDNTYLFLNLPIVRTKMMMGNGETSIASASASTKPSHNYNITINHHVLFFPHPILLYLFSHLCTPSRKKNYPVQWLRQLFLLFFLLFFSLCLFLIAKFSELSCWWQHDGNSGWSSSGVDMMVKGERGMLTIDYHHCHDKRVTWIACPDRLPLFIIALHSHTLPTCFTSQDKKKERITHHPPKPPPSPHSLTTSSMVPVSSHTSIHSTLFSLVSFPFFHSLFYFLRVAVGILNKWVISGGVACVDDDVEDAPQHPFQSILKKTYISFHHHHLYNQQPL